MDANGEVWVCFTGVGIKVHSLRLDESENGQQKWIARRGVPGIF